MGWTDNLYTSLGEHDGRGLAPFLATLLCVVKRNDGLTEQFRLNASHIHVLSS